MATTRSSTGDVPGEVGSGSGGDSGETGATSAPAGTATSGGSSSSGGPERPQVMLIVGDGVLSYALDISISEALQEHAIDVEISDESVTVEETTLVDLVVISESVQHEEITSQLLDVEVPLIVLEPQLWGDLKMAALVGGAEDSVKIVDDPGPLGAMLDGEVVSVFDADMPSHISGSAPNAITVGHRPTQVQASIIFAYAKDTAMQTGFIAPAPRVGWGVDLGNNDEGENQVNLSEYGTRLLIAAVEWSLPTP